MTRTSKYLNQDTIAALQSFQIEKIDREITDYLDTNNKMNTYHFEYCPKCGCYHPRLIKSGFAVFTASAKLVLTQICRYRP